MRNKKFAPESLMMSYGYHPEWSEGSIKPPVFNTSTFVFQTAEEGKAHFELAYGLRESNPNETSGLIYSRINNPNLQILEERLCLWDRATECAVFESGMSAISTVLLEFLKPGQFLLYSAPTYGGTSHFIQHVLPKFGIQSIPFTAEMTMEEINHRINEYGACNKLGLIYIESPANPTNTIIDISLCKRIAENHSSEEEQVLLAVDNTYMGPIWCQPLEHGADLVLYSATKYIGGHSDLIAGAVLGSQKLMQRVKTLRTFLGNMASPHTCWLLLRSLETLHVRMEKQAQNAQKVASFLQKHPKVEKISYLGLLELDSPQHKLYKKQYSSPGAMISLYIKGGEQEAFQFLNYLRLFKLAVSLGSTESLAQHPCTMTHAGMCPEEKARLGINGQLVRLSIGVENPDDLIWDITQALETTYIGMLNPLV